MDTLIKWRFQAIENAFFIEGGSLAVENGFKAAFDWKIRKS